MESKIHLLVYQCRKKSSGRPPHINSAAREQLKIELLEAQGFKSYTGIQTWLKAVEGI